MDTLDTQCLHLLRRFTNDFFKDKTGKGPEVIKVYSVKDKIFFELENYLTPMEKEIAKDQEGIKMVKDAREQLSTKTHSEYMGKAIELTKNRILHCIIFWDVENDRAFEVITLKFNN